MDHQHPHRQHAQQTNPRVVTDSGDTSPSPEPRQPLRRPLSHQSAVSDSDNKGPKPIPKPRQNLQVMHKVSKSLPSPSDLVVRQTEIGDPAVDGFWFCSYCTNLVTNSINVCDVCGADKEAD